MSPNIQQEKITLTNHQVICRELPSCLNFIKLNIQKRGFKDFYMKKVASWISNQATQDTNQHA